MPVVSRILIHSAGFLSWFRWRKAEQRQSTWETREKKRYKVEPVVGIGCSTAAKTKLEHNSDRSQRAFTTAYIHYLVFSGVSNHGA